VCRVQLFGRRAAQAVRSVQEALVLPQSHYQVVPTLETLVCHGRVLAPFRKTTLACQLINGLTHNLVYQKHSSRRGEPCLADIQEERHADRRIGTHMLAPWALAMSRDLRSFWSLRISVSLVVLTIAGGAR
jgi:hypothetical protein